MSKTCSYYRTRQNYSNYHIPKIPFAVALFIFPIICGSNVAQATSEPTDPVLTMTLGHESANLEIVVNNSNGTFNSSNNNSLARFGVVTTNYTGYSLSIMGSDDNGLLTNTNTSTVDHNTMSSIASATSEAIFKAYNNTSYNNKWGYKPSKYNSSANSNFLPSPTTTASLLDRTDHANTVSNDYTIALGARIDYSLATGNYTNTFVLTTVANPVPYAIYYLDNTSDPSVANLPSNSTTGNVDSDRVALPTNVPTRTGYTFTGWCDGVPTVSPEGISSCGSTAYQPSTTTTTNYIPVSKATNNTHYLYAMWSIDTYDVTVDFTGDGVDSVEFVPIPPDDPDLEEDEIPQYPTRTVTTSGSTANLVYNVSYTMTMNITNPADYKFNGWEINDSTYGTIENVEDNPTTFITNTSSASAVITAKSRSTHVAYCTAEDPDCMQYSTTYNSCGGTLMDARDGNTYSTTGINDLCFMTKNLDLPGGITLTSELSNVTANYALPASSQEGFTRNDQAYVYNTNSTNCGNGTDAGAQPCYSYYSYVAAAAGTNPTTANANATQDICPKGWRLPTKTEYQTLANFFSYRSYIVTAPFLGSPSSTWIELNDNNYGLGDRGYINYWSSTVSGAAYGYEYDVSLGNNGTASVTAISKMDGHPVRCVRALTSTEKTLPSNITSMQDFTNLTAAEKAAIFTNVNFTIKDARDNQDYTIAKLPDGNIWMTKNLNLAGGTALTPANSNVTSNYTLPASISNPETDGFSNNNTAYVYNSNSTTCASKTPCYSYYSYVAAAAGTNPKTANANATQDICPKGWRLPYSSEFNLFTQTNIMDNGTLDYSAAPLYIVGGGQYDDGSLDYAGNYGYYWSATTPSSSYSTKAIAMEAYNKGLSSYSNTTVASYYKRVGNSIRCVVK